MFSLLENLPLYTVFLRFLEELNMFHVQLICPGTAGVNLHWMQNNEDVWKKNGIIHQLNA